MDEFDRIFGAINLKQVISFLTGEELPAIDLGESTDTSMAIIKFDTNDDELIYNTSFVKAWGIARSKAQENLRLILALLLLKKKYKVTDLDMQLFLENFDEDKLF